MKKEINIDQSFKLLPRFINYVFWILLILFTNPGGILETVNEGFAFGRVTIQDIIFFLLSICYIISPKGDDIFDNAFIKVKKYLIFFLIYYFIVFCYLVPLFNENKDYSLIITLIKSRWFFYHILLAIYVYEFFKQTWDIFLKLFLFSSIIILVIFLQSLITKIYVLPVDLANRGFINIDRNLMVSYGLMPLLIPLGTAVLVLIPKVRYRTIILIGYTLMSLTWLVSITRRHILEIFIYLIIAFLYYLIINRNYKVLFINSIKILFITVSLATITYIFFPKYTYAAYVGIKESVSVLLTNRDLGGQKDLRMTLDKPFINQQIYDHPLLGTGFDNRWRTSTGDDQGYEASDYPFLASIAMFGIIGIIAFLPIYIYLIRVINKDFQYLKSQNRIEQSILFAIFLSYMIFFIYNFLQYFNYFEAISVPSNFIWIFSLSFYLALRTQFYKSEFSKNRILIHG